MKLELPEELEEVEPPPPPRPPATLAAFDPVDPLEDDDEEDEDEEPPLTVWPTDPLTAVTVPAMGARSVVAATAFSALWTLSCALSTLAWAAATVMVLVALDPELATELAPFDALDRVVVVVVVVVEAASSAWSSASCADCRSASACARSTSALAGSTLARISSLETCWPSSTYTWVISPLVAKSTSVWLAGSRLPLPETVDWITPRSTVAVRSCALEVSGELTTSAATTMAAAASTASARVVRAGLRAISARARARRALAARRRLPARRTPLERHAALLQRGAQLLELR